MSNYNKEQGNTSPKEEHDLISMSPTSNDGVHIAKLITDVNNRITNSGQTNNIPVPSNRDNTPNSPEITQF
jgi:hypothetical protein